MAGARRSSRRRHRGPGFAALLVGAALLSPGGAQGILFPFIRFTGTGGANFPDCTANQLDYAIQVTGFTNDFMGSDYYAVVELDAFGTVEDNDFRSVGQGIGSNLSVSTNFGTIPGSAVNGRPVVIRLYDIPYPGAVGENTPMGIALSLGGQLLAEDRVDPAILHPACASLSLLQLPVTSSVDPLLFGQSTTLTAAVTGAPSVATGTVNFRDDEDLLCPNVTLVAGTATCEVPNLDAGTHAIEASYSGDATHVAITGALELIVGRADTVTTILDRVPDLARRGEPLLVKVGVAPVPPGGGTPTGPVTITDGTDTCTVMLPDQDRCGLVPLGAGPVVVTASYEGDDHFNPSQASGGDDPCNGITGCRAALESSLPGPTAAKGAQKKVGRKLAALARATGRALDGAAGATGAKQTRFFKKARTKLSALLTTASGADGKGTLGVPLAPVQRAVEGLQAAIPG